MKIDRFTILRRLGAGAMGVVFAAYDERLDRKLAIKLLAPECSREDGERRFLREAQAMARLAHPNVVVVHEVGIHEAQVFIAMEFIEGPTLRAWLASPRRWQDVVSASSRPAGALRRPTPMASSIVTSSPTNVLVGIDGRTRVLDFGLARHADDGGVESTGSEHPPIASTNLTRSDGLAGTPGYLAPELLAPAL